MSLCYGCQKEADAPDPCHQCGQMPSVEMCTQCLGFYCTDCEPHHFCHPVEHEE